jgi:tetratricopeptide (TPR) repeat protein
MFPQLSPLLGARTVNKKISKIAFGMVLTGLVMQAPSRCAAQSLTKGKSSPHSAVRVWQDTLELPTYEEGLPDENPPFDQLVTNGRYNYPYTMRENLTNRVAPRRWRALNLENEYLKCVILPDLGGHLYRCLDKRNGADMFYANPSLKFARIAYRGAWAAYGIEFNFPVSHNWMTASPIDFSTSTAADGSASVWVRNVDRVYGMEWCVELTLHPGQALLEQKTTLYNPGRARHRFYWWTNAGVQVSDDTRIFYPTEFTVFHGFTDLDTWPVNRDGVDLSVVGNHKYGPVSRFSYASNEPWMAVYHPKTDAGVVHYSTRTNLPSKKFWSWGSDPDGLAWREALSDNHSAYVEVQAGLFRDQETYGFLEPQQKIRFTEYWMPVRELGAVAKANPDAALGIIGTTGSRSPIRSIDIGVNVFRDFPKANLDVLDETKEISSETISLTPSKTYHKQIENLKAHKAYTVALKDEHGKVILTHTEGKYDFTPKSEVPKELPPAYVYPPVEKRSESDFLQLGDEQERNGEVLDALRTYREGLKRFDRSVELHKAAGRLGVAVKQYASAVADLSIVMMRVSNDQEASYYLGQAYLASGELEKARRAFEVSEQYGTFRPAALYELAALDSRKGEFGKAHEELLTAYTEFPDAARLADMDVTLLRLLGDIGQAKTRLAKLRELDRANSFLRYEATRLDTDDPALWEHLAADPSRILEIAVPYMHFGLYAEAAEILARKYPHGPAVVSEPGMPRPEDDPMIAYYRGYCRDMLQQAGSTDFLAAAKMPSTFIFPNRPESFDVLRRAIAANPKDANAHALLGDLYMSAGMEDEAMKEWEAGRMINPALPALLRNMGYTALYTKQSTERAIELFTDGVKYDPQNAENYLGLERALKEAGRSPQEQANALQKFPGPHPPAMLVFQLARDLADGGQYDAAVKELADHFVSMEEGGASRLTVYLEIRLKEAKALAQNRQCLDAKMIVGHLGNAVPQLSLTTEELSQGLQSKAVREATAAIERACPN